MTMSKPSETPLAIRLLGSFEALRGGEAIPERDWGRRKTKTLLKVLLTEPGRVFTQDELIEALFEGENPVNAISNLHGRVSELRRALEPSLKKGKDSVYVLGRDGGYRFAETPSVWLDTSVFTALSSRAQSLIEQERWSTAASTYQAAVELYRGELLEEDRYAEWALSARERYSSKHLDGLMQLAECWARSGEFRKALDTCEEALRVQPHCESVYRQAMRYHCLAGEYSQALNDYARCVEVLDEYLGVEPDPQTQELYHLIKNRDPEAFARPVAGNRLAIIPFHCAEQDAELQEIAAASCNALITRLSMLESVWVASWMDVANLAHQSSGSEEIAETLRVRFILEGSLEWSQGQLRVSYRLVDALESSHAGAGRLELDRQGSRNLQDEVADGILQELQDKVKMFEGLRASSRTARPIELEELLLAARQDLAKRSERSLPRAIDSFRQALQRAPSDVTVWADLAMTYACQVLDGFCSAESVASDAQEALDRLAGVNLPGSKFHLARAMVKWLVNGDLVAAEDQFRAAVENDPGLGLPAHWYAAFLMRIGRIGEGIGFARRAQALDQSLLGPLETEIHARPWARPASLAIGAQIAPGDAGVLAKYLPRHALSKILAVHDEAEELKWLAFLFAEVLVPAGREAGTDPETLRRMLRVAVDRMVRAVAEFGGAVAQVRPRGILAIFGLPTVHEDDVERAVRAALRIRDTHSTPAGAGEASEAEWEFRCGIDVGRVLVDDSDAGSDVLLLPVGSAVRTAAALEAAAAPGEILVSNRVRQIVGSLFHACPAADGTNAARKRLGTAFAVGEQRAVDGKARGVEGLGSRMVGRDGELESLVACLDRAIEGRGSIATVVGEAGIGKTRLLSELLASVPDDKLRTVYHRCISYQSSHPYRTSRDLASSVLDLHWSQEADIATGLGSVSEWLLPDERERAQILPFLAALLGIEDSSSEIAEMFEPLQIHEQMTRSLARLVEETALRAPLVLIVDDAQWIDAESALILGELMAVADRAPLLLILAYRDELTDRSRQLDRKARDMFAHRHTGIGLHALQPLSQRSQIEELLPSSALPEELYETIARKSEGNPLFAEEIIRLLIDRGAIRMDEEEMWQSAQALADIEIPPRLVGLLSARIGSLSSPSREILQVAATLGRAFGRSLLAACLTDQLDLDACLMELQRAGVLLEVQGAPEQQFAFRHDLIRETAYETLPGSRRIRIHSRVATAIEALGSEALDDLVSIGDHLYQARAWDRAEKYLLLAAEDAWNLYKSAEASTLLEKALDAAERQDEKPPEELFAIRKRRAEVFALLGQAGNESLELSQAQQLAEQIGTSEVLVEVGLLWADFWSRRADYSRALDHASRTLKKARADENEAAKARALLARAGAAFGLANFEEARRDLLGSLDILQRSKVPETEAAVRRLLGVVTVRLGDYDLAMQHFESSLALYEQLRDRKGEAAIAGNLGALKLLTAQYEGVIQHTQTALTFFEAIGDATGRAKCLTNLGLAHQELGSPNTALELHTQARALYEEVDDGNGKAKSLMNLGIAHVAIDCGVSPELILHPLTGSKHFANGRRLTHEALELFGSTGDRLGEATALFNLGSLAVCEGNTSEARGLLAQAREISRELSDHRLEARTLAAMARLELQSGKIEESCEFSLWALQVSSAGQVAVMEEIHFTRYAVLLAAGQPEEAFEHLSLAKSDVLDKATAIMSVAQKERFLSYCGPILAASSAGTGH